MAGSGALRVLHFWRLLNRSRVVLFSVVEYLLALLAGGSRRVVVGVVGMFGLQVYDEVEVAVGIIFAIVRLVALACRSCKAAGLGEIFDDGWFKEGHTRPLVYVEHLG